MADESNYHQQFSGNSDTYIKFIIYQTVIIFTIVFSLQNAVINVKSVDVEKKVDEAKSLESLSGRKCYYLINDDLLQKMYFPLDTASDNKTEAEPDKKENAYQQQVKLLKDIEDIYTKAFVFKLGFLGNVEVDLRSWIFILPFILLLSLVYVFILDYKIETLFLKAKESGNAFTLIEQQPFKFIRTIFYALQLILILVYANIFTLFFQSSELFFSHMVIHGYIIMFYYSFIYCCYLFMQFNRESGLHVKLPMIKRYAWVKNKLKLVLFKLSPFIYLRTGQILLLITLMLVMSYTSCQGKEEYVKGYQLIITNKTWETTYGFFTEWFFKYLYIITIVFTIILFFVKFKSNTQKISKAVKTFFIAACFVYTVYFGTSDVWSDIGFILLILMIAVWYFGIYRNMQSSNEFDIKSFELYILFLFPFICFGFYNTLTVYNKSNGWFWYFTALWLILSAIIFLNNRNKSLII